MKLAFSTPDLITTIIRSNNSNAYLDPALLVPNANNPRLHKTHQIKALTKSIQAFGFNIPIVADLTGQVISGHAR
ncbi:MAG: ParB-like chromosome segregation protein Spo0J [Methylophilaceae bacterium]